MSLKNKTISALSWSAIDRFGSQGVQFVISIILARLLLPEQFGLIGMLTIFFAVAQTFVNSGFGSALIQKQDATHIDECSIFYFNIFVGFVAVGVLWLCAPLIAAFYDQPILTPLTRFLSLNIIINSFALIQTTLLSKNIDFKTQTKVSIVSAVLSGIIGIILAYQGLGVWALAIQQVCGNLFRAIFLWLWFAWRPSLVFSFAALRQLFGYGSKLLLSGLLDTIFQNIYLIVIGKLFSPAALGFYTRAKLFQQMTSENFTSILSRVSFPIFSTLQNEPVRLKYAVKKSLTFSAYVVFPAMIGLAVVAEPLVIVLLTEKWLPCVPYLQLLCVIGLTYPLHVFNLSVLKSKGRSDLFLRLEIIKKVLITLNIVVTWRWEIEAMICGQIVLTLIAYYLNSYYTASLINYSTWEQIKDLMPALTAALLMGAGVFAIQRLLPQSSALLNLLVQIGSGMLLYAAISKLLHLSVFDEIVLEIRGRLGFAQSA